MAKRNDYDLSLINLVKDRPTLWDSRLDDFKLTDRKESVWKEVADTLGCSVGKLA